MCVISSSLGRRPTSCRQQHWHLLLYASSIQWFIYHRGDTCHTCQTPREVHSLVIGFVAHPPVTPQTESLTVERWALTSAHGTFHHITVDHLTPRTVIRPFRHRARQDSTSVAIATVRVMFFIVVLGTRFLGRSFSRVFFRSPDSCVHSHIEVFTYPTSD